MAAKVCKTPTRGKDSYQNTVALPDTTAPSSGSSGPGGNIAVGLTSDPSVTVGDWVRLNGSTVVQALADSATNSRVIGICVNKSSSVLADVQVSGFTDSIFAGLTTNTNYFLSDASAGQMTTTPPVGAGHIVLMLGRPITTTQFIIMPGEPLIRAS